MWLVLVALFVALDLYLLFTLAGVIGACPTLVLLLLVGALGAQLVRLSGLRMLRDFQAALARGEAPEEGVIEGLLLLVSGASFALPGMLSDAVGLALLVPPLRRSLARRLRARFERAVAKGTVRVVGFGPMGPVNAAPPPPGVIDVEGADVSDEDPRRLS